MRIGVPMALAGVLSPVLVLLPAATATVSPNARAVAPAVRHLAVGRPVGGPADMLAALPAQSAAPFSTVGATWSSGTLRAGQALEVRVRHAGSWSGWTRLEASDSGPDAGTADDRAASTRGEQASEPLWVGAADGVQARVRRLAGSKPAAARGPGSLQLVLVDPGSSPADDDPAGLTVRGAAAEAAASAPAVFTRAQWGADERLRSRNAGCGTPDYSTTIKVGFVHHTDTPNGYAAADVPSILRGMYAYHVQSNGWCDIGYNFVIDRFGRTWEGRYGGIDKAVVGAHTGGFNANSFAASLLGTYSSVTPGAAMQAAITRLYAWKLGAYYRDPLGTETLTSAGTIFARWPTGTVHTFNVVSGHRDADYTTCPGADAYALLPSLRTRISAALGAGLTHPSATTTAAGTRVHAGVLRNQAWALTVTDATTGSPVRRYASTTSPGTGIDVTWDRHTTQGLPAFGTFDLTLSSTAGTSTAVPFQTRVPGAVGLTRPDATPTTAGTRVRAGVPGNQAWALTVTDATTGSTVRRYASTASPSTGIDVTWDRRTTDLLPAVGTFDLTLSSTAGTSTAVPFRTRVTIPAPDPAAEHTAPSVTLTAPPSPTRSRSVTVPVTVTDPDDTATALGLLCTVDQGPPHDCTGPLTAGNVTDGVHTMTVTATDAAGNISAPAQASWTVDGTAPSVTQDSPTSAVTLVSALPVAWSAKDTGSGVASTDTRYRTATATAGFGAFVSPVAWQASTARRASLPVSRGREYCLSSRARDAAGNTSAWTAERCTSVALDDRALRPTSGTWLRQSAAGYYQGTRTNGPRTGAVLSAGTVTAGRVTLIATRCARCGSVAVYLGATRLATLSTYASTTIRSAIFVLPRRTVTTGTLTVRTLTNTPVYVDGLATSRR